MTASELADLFWQGTRNWPSTAPTLEEELRSSTKLAIDDFRNEITCLLAFVDDFVFHVALKEAPSVFRDAVREAYAARLRSFAQQTACKPMPMGEWVGSLYLTNREYQTASMNNDPIRNLDDRFQFFVEAIQRGKGHSIGESLGTAFAGLCATTDIVFIAQVSTLLSERVLHFTELLRKNLSTS